MMGLRKLALVISILMTLEPCLGADLTALKALYTANYNHYYVPRFCGKGIARLIREAQARNISLSGAYVLKIKGQGFLETSAFYGRARPNDRLPLTYYHFVLVADENVFDFDLDYPIVLNIKNYFRLQFTPPFDPFYIVPASKELLFKTTEELSSLELTRYELEAHLKSDSVTPTTTWVKKLEEIYNVDQIMKIDRKKLIPKRCDEQLQP